MPVNNMVQTPTITAPLERKVLSTPNTPTTNPGEIQVPPPAEKKEDSSPLFKTLTGLAIVSSAAYLLYNLRKGGNMVKTLENFKAEGGKFEKGLAKNKDGSLFEGILQFNKESGTGTCTYVKGRLVSASKNYDEASKLNTDKIENYIKEYSYDSEGKLISIKRKVAKNGTDTVETLTPRRDIKTAGKAYKRKDTFKEEGYKFVDGKAVDKEGNPFTGVIAEKLGNDVMLREYKDGIQISERYNKTLKDHTYRNATESYTMDIDDLAEREEDIIIDILKKEDAKTAERMAKEKLADLVEAVGSKKAENAKPLNQVKSFFSKIFSSKKS